MSYKQRKVVEIMAEITAIKGQTSYDVSGVKPEIARVCYRLPTENFQDLTSGDYTWTTTGSGYSLQINNEVVRNTAEAYQVYYVHDIQSSKYTTDFEVDINTLVTRYNEAVDDIHRLWLFTQNLAFVSDDTTIPVILPQLGEDEIWMRKGDGYVGVTLTDAEGMILDMINKYVTDKKQEISDHVTAELVKADKHILDETLKRIQEITEHTDVMKQEITDLTTAQKKILLDYVNLTLKPMLLAYVNNELKPMLLTYVNTVLKPDLESYTIAKKGELNTATQGHLQTLINKTNELLSLLETKESELETALSNFTETLKTALNNHTNEKKVEITNHANSESQRVQDEVVAKGEEVKDEINQLTPDNLGRRVEALENSRVSRTGDSITGTLNINMEGKDKVVLKSGGTIDGVVGSDTNGVIMENSKSGLGIRLNNDGVGIYPSSSLKTESKELTEAINEVSQNLKDTSTELRNNKLDKVNTIEELKSQNLKVGDIVEVLGYYTAGDGAGHKRKIEETDDGSGVQLANGLWANIVHNGEVNVSWFGAKNDISTSSQDIFDKVTIFVNKLKSNIKIKFPNRWSFIYGRQTQTVKQPDDKSKPFYTTTNGFEILNEGIEIEFDLNYCNFTKIPSCRYGAFDPLTGEPHPSTGYFINPPYATPSPTFINVVKPSTFVCVNGFIDGTSDSTILGGTYGDTGRQLQHSGVKVIDATGFIYVSNVHCKNMNLDGFSLNGTTKNNPNYLYTKLYDSSTDRCGRMGVTIAGGEDVTLKNSIFTRSGTSNLPVSSVPKSGCDIENESGAKLHSIRIINCHFEEAGNTCLVSDSGDIESISIENSKMLNTEGHSIFIRKKNCNIYNSVTSGRIAALGLPNSRCNMYNCIITDSSEKYSILQLDNYIYSGSGYLVEGEIDMFGGSILSEDPERTYVVYDRVGINNTYLNSKNEGAVFNFKYSKGVDLGNVLFKSKANCMVFDAMRINLSKDGYLNGSSFSSSISPFGIGGFRGDIILNNGDRYPISDIFAWVCVASGSGPNQALDPVAYTVEGSNIVHAEVSAFPTRWDVITIPDAVDRARVLSFTNTGNSCVLELDKNCSSTLNGVPIEFPNPIFEELKLDVATTYNLNTPYHATKMQEEGVYEDFIAYMDEKTAYDKQQRKKAFMSVQPMTLNLVEEPQPSDALKKFMDKYL